MKYRTNIRKYILYWTLGFGLALLLVRWDGITQPFWLDGLLGFTYGLVCTTPAHFLSREPITVKVKNDAR